MVIVLYIPKCIVDDNCAVERSANLTPLVLGISTTKNDQWRDTGFYYHYTIAVVVFVVFCCCG